ncbi:unnamed protein product [Cyprideis torosa]|uniref:PLOD1-3-like GT domain-containing protein n=1 Tax=Cyprideis torosa TaxID=163714 RepID=A0A7R8W3A4_9CRUS|nr:unnamed protein product [Cyprideis torosa]CAG0881937.1 unnamed protein product [Cyprideis torosa]
MATFNLLVSLFLAVASLQIAISEEPNTSDAGLLVLTVATDTTDGLDRFLRSAKVYGHRVKVLGQGEDWRGGDVVRYPGGGQKVRILREEVAKHKDNPDLLIMFTDSYDVILNAPPSQFLDEFQTFGSRVVFSAESVCWPDESLADKYPEVPRGKRFLNSGAFIGYAPEIYEIVTHHDIEDADDDQLYYTKIFLDEGLRKKLDIKLDHKSQLFQNINGATSELVLGFRGTEAFVENTLYSTVPLLLHGNGPTKQILNHYGNYLAKAWNPQDGCMECKERMNFLDGKDPKEFPRVMLALFIEQGTPFIEEWFKSLSLQEYPKDRMDLFIHNAAEYHDDHVAQYVREFGKKYASLKVIHSSDNTKEWHARNLALEHFTSKEDAEWLFSVDSVAHLDNPYSIKLLVEQNRTVIAPLLIRPYKAWSNFWGALTTDGFYARSPDYMDIVQNKRR